MELIKIRNVEKEQEQEDNHCEGCLNLPDTLNQRQGYNSDISYQQFHNRSSIQIQTLEVVSTSPKSKGHLHLNTR